MNDMIKSIIRTIVPYLVGIVVSSFASIGIEVDSAAMAQVVAASLAALYYVVVRLLGMVDPRFEYMLVVPAKPSYDANS